MVDFITQQVLFYFAIIMVLFLPGYFLLNLIESRKKYFSSLEKFIISVGLSIVTVNFLLIIIGRMEIVINKASVIFSIILLVLLLQFITHVIKKSNNKSHRPEEFVTNKNSSLSFSKNQTILILLILFLTIFIKTVYLKDTIFPTSTDLGHHMYWAKSISTTGHLPVYQEQNIISANNGYQISPPQKIADFIIGEHLIFSAVNLISGIDFISYFPSLILFLIHIFGILMIFILALRLFGSPASKNIAILSLFFIGPLYAISSSQAKFISGGVIGNTIGNLLIPLAIYFLIRALEEKNSIFMALAIFTAVGLVYIHHLSAFVFIFIFLFAALIFAIFNIKSIGNHSREWFQVLFKPAVITAIAFFALMLFIYLPSYLDASAVQTAVGTPEKTTRTGLTFSQLKFTAGEARLALAIIAVFILAFSKKIKNYPGVVISGWFIAVFIMSWKPSLLFINIPSNRIANYISFPVAILSAFAFGWLLEKIKGSQFNNKFTLAIYSLLFTAVVASGFYDNSQSLKTVSGIKPALETFAALKYLSDKVSPSDIIIKDHNYITADSWIKLFFMRDYNFPLSRGLLKRYEDETTKREMCTLWMISTPNLENGQRCYNDLGVNFVMVNPNYDSGQFEKSEEFEEVYMSDNIAIFHRN